MYKLYYSPGACSLTAHIALEEIGEPYEAEIVWTDKTKPGMTTSSPEWKKINPKGYVPVLAGVEGASGGLPGTLTEANAILLFLARKFPHARLLPPTPEGEGRCFEWLNYISGTVHGGSFAGFWRPERFAADEKDHPAVQVHAWKKLDAQFAYMESLMADGRDWLVPGHYSIADSYLLAVFRWGHRIGVDTKATPSLMNHAGRMAARPAVASVFKKEGIAPL